MKTVTVRIPLVIDVMGNWTAIAYEDEADSRIQTAQSAADCLDVIRREYTIVADVPLPEDFAPERRGAVEPA